MLIAGEASGDLLAAELVVALRAGIGALPTYQDQVQPLSADLAPRFFGAGGPRMAEAGVELAFDLTLHSVTGLSDVLKNYRKFRRLFNQLLTLAKDREPDAIICIDFSGFNRRFAAAIKGYIRARRGTFNNWNPKIIQYVSPQVWASREDRVWQVARDFDLLLSILPFEKDWYAARVPELRAEFVGHPIIDRHQGMPTNPAAASECQAIPSSILHPPSSPSILLLPGNAWGELKQHLPVMLEALKLIQTTIPNTRATMVLPTESLLAHVKGCALPSSLEIRCGGLAFGSGDTDVAIASTGTVTLECAYFRVPTVAMYRTSWSTYQIGKRLIKVKYLAMQNLLARRRDYAGIHSECRNAGKTFPARCSNCCGCGTQEGGSGQDGGNHLCAGRSRGGQTRGRCDHQNSPARLR